MLRGVIGGLIWGAVLAVLALAVASLLAPLPATVTPQTETAATRGGQDAGGGGGLDQTSQADAPVASGDGGPATEPAGDDALPDTDTAPAPVPETGTASDWMDVPFPGAESGIVPSTNGDDAPVAGNAAPAPEVPEAEGDLSISTDPAQPAPPPVPETGAFDEPGQITAPGEDAGAALPGDDPAPETGPVAEAPDAVGSQDAVPEAETGSSGMRSAPEIEDGSGPEMAAPGDQDAATEETLLKPAGDLSESFPQLKSNRLPTVGEDNSPAGVAEDAAAQAPRRAIDLYRAAHDDPAGKPLMSIVLIDDGQAAIGVEALESFPYPLSFAVSTLAPDAREKMEYYRSRGFEVLAMIDLPETAAARDVEVAMQAHLEALPEAAAVLEGTADGVQGSREVSDQVTEILKETGHGLVMHPKGLNTARKLAEREGIPAATVFRDFDGEGQSPVVMRRFLDHAAFKARQEEGGVIMLGRLRPDTVSALLLWALQDRVEEVALVPVSAVLLSDQGESG
ncbi:Uncharacterized conserved protein YibQ, putative polysaccharide deacetylase 2 family [Salinihabitans flavidus]|uniref:Uncharacterized conserved protein YibQ, putative polysaccharide deacetylase 2 family n=1 Tax=Salinihabitans flavidus TaxID=569882 RepID=A0A1H8TVS2_9RHOB|nr:divergent polysaccharide deacetylase family protein [Salinihabitans flavidus]SEO95112.1 Uncharacterized conserved protein YibQ, putative polysaccharide deacetylase 2 family [Salinihabitans flavidus]